MTDLVITNCTPVLVNPADQKTLPAAAAITIGQAVYLVAATGKFGVADANGAAPINEPEGIAIKAAKAANDTVTAVQKGLLDVGDALDAMDFGAPVFLSRTAGSLADADEGDGILIGEVWPGWAATTPDKLLYVNIRTLADVAPNSVTGSMLAGNFMNVSLLAGQDGGSDPTYTLTGAAVGDEIVFVGHLTTAASIASLADVTADFSVTAAAELTDGGPTDYTNDQLMVIWLDLT